jgi:hypothetical protein
MDLPNDHRGAQLRGFLNRPMINNPLTALGAVCGFLLLAYAILILLEMVLATQSFPSPSILPPPTARPVVALIVLAAAIRAFFATKRHVHTQDAFSKLSLVAPVAVVVIFSLFVLTSRHHQQRYLHDASANFPQASSATLTHDGHQACDWLRGRHWGTPPELPARRVFRFYNAIAHGNYVTAAVPTAHGSQSTGRLLIFYTRYLRRQDSAGVLTPDEKLKRQVAFQAWFEMCPFQQWVHRPLGGSGSGD